MASNILAELTECPICFERLSLPIQTCKRGHSICKNCRKTVSVCPTCRGEFSTYRNTHLDQLIETIPTVCRNRKMGCEKEIAPHELTKHEAACDYRPVPCIWHLQCGQQDVVFCQYNKHLEEVHSLYTKKIRLHEETSVIVKTKTDSINRATIILCDERNQLYFIRRCVIDLQAKTFFVSVHFIGKSENAKKYLYKVKIDQGLHSSHDAYYTYTAYCLPYIESCANAVTHPRSVVLDTRKVFLTDKHLSEIKYSVLIERVSESN